MTPERLISYFRNKDNPSIQYMFIDEAHKIIKEDDSRAPVYYHAISMADRRSVKLYFASPNITNSDIFLKIFDKNTDESISITESPVSQYKYFVDLIDNKGYIFLNSGKIKDANHLSNFSSFNQLLYTCGNNTKNIIYCNSIHDTINYALSFANSITEKKDEKIDNLIELIKDYIHEEYYLIDCLRKGVGFHFGRLPQRIRNKIEELFLDGTLDYMFCTSTLLEGVNLPAKNIFILNNKIGSKKFERIDFWNLAGRAGRLRKELSGNIICVRAEENKWKSKDYMILKENATETVNPMLISGSKNFYKNLDNVMHNKEFTRKNVSANEEEFLNNFSNIVFTHSISGNDSFVINAFVKDKSIDGKSTLDYIHKRNKVAPEILEQSITIKPKYQNLILSLLEKRRL